jgi:hypothetical protein
MYRQNYLAAAKMIQTLTSDADRETVTAFLAELFAADNDRFSERVFRDACRPPAPPLPLYRFETPEIAGSFVAYCDRLGIDASVRESDTCEADVVPANGTDERSRVAELAVRLGGTMILGPEECSTELEVTELRSVRLLDKVQKSGWIGNFRDEDRRFLVITKLCWLDGEYLRITDDGITLLDAADKAEERSEVPSFADQKLTTVRQGQMVGDFRVTKVTARTATVVLQSDRDLGAKVSGKRLQFRFDGTGFTRQGQYLRVNGIG